MIAAYIRILDIVDDKQRLLFNLSINGLALLVVITMAKYYLMDLSVTLYTLETD